MEKKKGCGGLLMVTMVSPALNGDTNPFDVEKGKICWLLEFCSGHKPPISPYVQGCLGSLT